MNVGHPSCCLQARNEVCGIRDQRGGIRDKKDGIWDHSPGIRDHKPCDLDQQLFKGSGIRLYYFYGIREQTICHAFGIKDQKERQTNGRRGNTGRVAGERGNQGHPTRKFCYSYRNVVFILIVPFKG